MTRTRGLAALWLFATAAVADESSRLAVSVPPLAEMAERLGADRVAIELLLPPGAAPETWAPTPREAVALARADLFLAVGHPDLAAERFVAARGGTGPGAERIGLAEDLAGGAARGSDPHLWMDPDLMAATARRLADWLARRHPSARAEIERRANAYLADLRAADVALADRLSSLRRPIVMQHPAWRRLLERHGVEMLVVEADGKDPSARRLAGLVRQAERLGVTTLFTQVGVSDRGARLIASELGAELVALDPMARDWIENLRRAGEAFAAAGR